MTLNFILRKKDKMQIYFFMYFLLLLFFKIHGKERK